MKAFISQPMRGKTDDEIKAERENMISVLKTRCGDDVEVLDSFFEDFNGNGLAFLAKSIEVLSKADVAIFAAGWEGARGCRIEHECAVQYGVKVLE